MNNNMRERERERKVVVEVSFESALIASVTSSDEMHSDFLFCSEVGVWLLVINNKSTH